MNKKPTIKIVKRQERLRVPEAPAPAPTPEQNPTEQARTVTEWIREFKKKGGARVERTLTSFSRPSSNPQPA